MSVGNVSVSSENEIMPINGGLALSTNCTNKWQYAYSSGQIAQFFFDDISRVDTLSATYSLSTYRESADRPTTYCYPPYFLVKNIYSYNNVIIGVINCESANYESDNRYPPFLFIHLTIYILYEMVHNRIVKY